MLGSCIIDGIDIGTLGMFILRGGDYDFLSFPERKTPPQNNWAEVNGLDVDLSEAYFKEKRVTVRFYISSDTGQDYESNLNTFYRLISAPGVRQIYSREFDKTFSLRYVTCPQLEHTGGLYKQGRKRSEISVEFSMDDPLQLFPDAANLMPRNGRSSQTYVKINGREMADFGIIVNECYNSILKLASVKKPLTRSLERKTGLTVFTPSQTVFEAKSIVIDCTMTAASRDDFYYNYNALFNNMRQGEEIILQNYSGYDFCFYSSMSGFEKMAPFGRRILVKFTLNLICINPGLVVRVWGTEDSNIIVSEDLKNSIIYQ